jgi:hypothetical protein
MSLLGAQILLLVLMPLDFQTWLPIRKVLYSIVILMAVNQAATHRRALYIALALATPALLGNWLNPLLGKDLVQVMADLCTLLLFLYLILLMVGSVLKAPTITVEVILLSICSYIMLGFLWALAFHTIIILHPDGSAVFSLAPGLTSAEVLPELFYFSFVTLTTLGFGDISPVAPLARSLTILEAMAGPLFLAVLIAYLVGKFAATNGDEGS